MCGTDCDYCRICPLYENHWCREELKKQSLETIKKLEEKQIPKKGKIEYVSSYTDEPPVMSCPCCGNRLPVEGCYIYTHCYNCGQALDWSDT